MQVVRSKNLSTSTLSSEQREMIGNYVIQKVKRKVEPLFMRRIKNKAIPSFPSIPQPRTIDKK